MDALRNETPWCLRCAVSTRRSAIAFLLIGAVMILGAYPVQARTKARAKDTTGTQTGGASWYTGYKYTASGRFNPDSMTAAHKTLPFGTVVRAKASNGNSVDVTIDNRGPFIRGRILDLTPAAFKKLAPLNKGVVRVQMDILSRPSTRPRS